MQRGFLAVLSALLAPCVLAQPSPPSVLDLTALDLARATEIWRVLDVHGYAVWPGWEPPPHLLRHADADYLIGHPSPPADFVRVLGVSVAGRAVYRRAGHLVPVPAGTAWSVAGVWSLALPTLEEFQRAVDQVLGVGVIRLDDAAYTAAAVHEAFHAHQMTVMNGQPPTFGFQGDEPKLLTDLSRLPNLAGQLVAEGQALRDALTAADLATVWKHAARFLELRRARRQSLPAALQVRVARYEQSLEWLEGLARYADVHLMRLTGNQPSGDGRFVYPASAWTVFLGQLANLKTVPGTVRDWYYVLGAGQAFLLDRLLPGWKPDVLPGGGSLEQRLIELTERAMSIPSRLLAFALARLKLANATIWVALADQPERWQKGLGGVSSMGSLDGLLFCFPEKIQVSFFMKGALMPLDIAFLRRTVHSSGSCRWHGVALCSSDPCPTFGPDRAFKHALEAPAGRLIGLPDGSHLHPPR